MGYRSYQGKNWIIAISKLFFSQSSISRVSAIQHNKMPVLKPLAGSKDAPQQHKQTSRKGKKAWRKNVDVTEVQEGLEEVRDELIAG